MKKSTKVKLICCIVIAGTLVGSALLFGRKEEDTKVQKQEFIQHKRG